VGLRTRSRRTRWGAAVLAALALGVGVTVALPASAGPAGQDAAPAADGPSSEKHSALTTRSTADASAADTTVAAAALATNLSYSTVEPCRAFDSRQAGGPFGFGDGFFLAFGGSCGLPGDGSIRAVMANVISVNATGTGYVRATAWDPTFSSPGATILNFNNGLVSSNAVPLPVCDPTVITCDWDVDLWIPAAATSNIVIDVIGYFS
jgi:hypothetical protein